MNFPQLINYLKRSRKEDVKDCIVVLYKTWENNETTKTKINRTISYAFYKHNQSVNKNLLTKTSNKLYLPFFDSNKDLEN